MLVSSTPSTRRRPCDYVRRVPRNAGIWGLNHCFVALLKVAAILAKDKEQLKKLWVLTAATAAYVVKWNNDVADYGGDLGGFVVVCGLQTLSIGYLAFA